MGKVKVKTALPTTIYSYYEVFAREKLEGQLAHIGCLSAPNEESALAQARLVYSEKPWVEMCMVKRDNVIQIISINDIPGTA